MRALNGGSVKVMLVFGTISVFARRADAAITQVTLDQGLGYVGYLIIGMIMITSLILIGVGGYQLSQDSGKGKLTIAAGVLIPVFIAIVYYVFKSILKINIDFTSTL